MQQQLHAYTPCMHFEIIIKLETSSSQKTSCQTLFRQLVFWLLVVLSYYFTKFNDFSMIIQVLSNSRIFSMHGTFLVIFQVFQDFQSMWEPCLSSLLLIVNHNWAMTWDFQQYGMCDQKASDQPAHSLIRAFASRLNILGLLSYRLNILWSL